MKFKLLILSLPLILLPISASHSNENCFPTGCEKILKTPITYSVVQPTCGTCFYDVYYSECIINGNSIFIIDSIHAKSTNPPCCQGTATNDPIVSGFILQEAARLINPGGVYTPSRCWKWFGILGPHGVHNAVFVPCDYDISCCYFYSGTWAKYGPDTCIIEQGCMQICD